MYTLIEVDLIIMTSYHSFFSHATGIDSGPFDYQRALASGPALPELLTIPTGCGKTAAAVLAWLWRRRFDGEARSRTPRRLVYCLPMRVLVEQTRDNIVLWLHRLGLLAGRAVIENEKVIAYTAGEGRKNCQEDDRPVGGWATEHDDLGEGRIAVTVLMGGEDKDEWDRYPERDAVIVGTQDMLLSRALNRGYGMSRYRWPVQFGLLNNDCLWVLDEVQLMDVGFETSAQLAGLRETLGIVDGIGTHSMWMSATIDRSRLNTVDHDEPRKGWSIQSINTASTGLAHLRGRLKAPKRIEWGGITLAKTNMKRSKLVGLVKNEAETLEGGEISDRLRKLFSKKVRPLGDGAEVRTGDEEWYIEDGEWLYSIRVSRGKLNAYPVPYVERVADLIANEHVQGTLTLAILNTVQRAQKIYSALIEQGCGSSDVVLIHSRFRPRDRTAIVDRLGEPGDCIIIATQVVEAGVDISAKTLITELAPWSSLVQRFGRCNRYGEYSNENPGRIIWLDLDIKFAKTVLPYDEDALSVSRKLLADLEYASPSNLESVEYEPPVEFHTILRRKDMFELFDTTPDLTGNDIDVSCFIRDLDDTDVQFYWREISDKGPNSEHPSPQRDELCNVPIGAAKKFLKKRSGWLWDHLDSCWVKIGKGAPAENGPIRPGQSILLDTNVGGYSPTVGWTGKSGKRVDAVPVIAPPADSLPPSGMNAEESELHRRWVTLTEHCSDVEAGVNRLATRFGLDGALQSAVITAARWHDVGKAHDAFQNMLTASGRDPPDETVLWAKSNRVGGRPDYWVRDHEGKKRRRRYFRHELASALGWLQLTDPSTPERDLIMYLIGAHHGKVRQSIRSLPGETTPEDTERLFARGVWNGDELPLVEGITDSAVALDLTPMRLGEGSWLERSLRLRNRYGPFILAYLEAIVRVVDWRISAEEGVE